MSLKKGRFLFLVVTMCVLALAVAVGGCRKAPAEQPPVVEPAPAPEPEPVVQAYEPPPEPAPMPEPAPAPPPPPVKKVELGDVFFAFDKFDLTEESRTTLADNADILMDNPDARILIEGHCDERGTREYNLGLGERRANSAQKYLVSLGISPSRIETISYGEDRPFEMGHNEAAWSKNRRAHFVVR